MLVLEKSRIYQGNLILVNREFPVRFQQPQRELRPVFPGQPEILMERAGAGMLKQLLSELEWGMAIVGVSGYRSRAEQTEIFEDSLRENGREFTEKYVAFPDHSEHQTGFAIDLAENKPDIDFIRPDFPYEGICQKFRQRAAAYGFVERYAEEKQEITGIGAEPWHFRYVGAPHAQLMQEQNMALEEYIVWLKQFDLKQNPLTVRQNCAEIRIGYVKAQGDYTRIEGLEEMMERTRLGYLKLQEANQDIAWRMCRGEHNGGIGSEYSARSDKSRNSIQISGNNQDGFILTCIMGEYLPSMRKMYSRNLSYTCFCS